MTKSTLICHYAKLFHIPFYLAGWRISCGLERERARAQACQLQPFDGRRAAPDRKRMKIRRPDGAA